MFMNMMFTNVHESYGVTRTTRRTSSGYLFIRAIAQDLQGSHHLNAITVHVVVVAKTTVRSIPSDPRTQTTVPACQTDHFMCNIARKVLILKSLCQSFVLCRAM